MSNFLSTDSAEKLLANENTLAVLRYESGVPAGDENASKQAASPIRISAFADQSAYEVWASSAEVIDSGVSGNLHWRRTDRLQFIRICLPLSQEDDFQQTSYAGYMQLLEFIKASALPELIRFWNYLPFINYGDGDDENYKRFCTGRLNAFVQCELTDLRFPSASAVGHYTQGLTICALTTASPAQHLTNPRQVDAFKYPRQYGSSSPSFARATTVRIGDENLCFISGTASILGHSSVHQGDLRLQLYTTNDNILYLIEEAGFTPDSIQTMRVYLRNPSDFDECKSLVSELYPDVNLIITHADICRLELLVEIECFCAAQAE